MNSLISLLVIRHEKLNFGQPFPPPSFLLHMQGRACMYSTWSKGPGTLSESRVPHFLRITLNHSIRSLLSRSLRQAQELKKERKKEYVGEFVRRANECQSSPRNTVFLRSLYLLHCKNSVKLKAQMSPSLIKQIIMKTHAFTLGLHLTSG